MAESETTAGRKVAILIGSQSFPDEDDLHDLACPGNDVDGMEEILSDPDIGAFDQIVKLKDVDHTEAIEKIHDTVSTLTPPDTLFFYYSGHGKLDPVGHLHLTTHNTTLDKLTIRSLPFGTVRRLISDAACNAKVLMLDCCYSGAVDEQFNKGDLVEAAVRPPQGSGMVVFTSSSDIETSREDPESGYGLYTGTIIEGIRSGEADMNTDGHIDEADLTHYIHHCFKGPQSPQSFSSKKEGPIVLAKSGQGILKKSLEKLRGQLADWLKAEEITAPQFAAVTAAMKTPPIQRSPVDLKLVQLGQDVIKGGVSIGQFWERFVAALEGEKSVQPIEKPPETKKQSETEEPEDVVQISGRDDRTGQTARVSVLWLLLSGGAGVILAPILMLIIGLMAMRWLGFTDTGVNLLLTVVCAAGLLTSLKYARENRQQIYRNTCSFAAFIAASVFVAISISVSLP